MAARGWAAGRSISCRRVYSRGCFSGPRRFGAACVHPQWAMSVLDGVRIPPKCNCGAPLSPGASRWRFAAAQHSSPLPIATWSYPGFRPVPCEPADTSSCVTVKQNRCRSLGTKLSGLTFAIWFSQTVKGGRIEGLDRLRRRNSRDLTGRSGGFECCRPESHQAAFLFVLQRRPAPRAEGAGPRRPWSRGYIQRATAAARAQGHPCANHAGTGAARGRSVDDHAAVISRLVRTRGCAASAGRHCRRSTSPFTACATDSADGIAGCSEHSCGVAAIDEQGQVYPDGRRSTWRHCDCVGKSHRSRAFGQRRNSGI